MIKQSKSFIYVISILLAGCHSIPEDAALNPFDLFESELKNFMQLTKVPGMAVCITTSDSTIYFRGFGYSDLENKRQVTDSSIFWLSSLTKPLTATVLGQMSAERIISFDDSLSFFPNKYFSNVDITHLQIKHVMSHTSEGNPPGSIFLYNGNRFNMLFNVFDGVGRRSDDEFPLDPFFTEMDLRLIEPLKLENTLLSLSGGKYEEKRHLVVTPYYLNRESNQYEYDSATLASIYANPGQGMLSSTKDLATISRAIDKGFLIGKKDYNNMTRPYINSPDGTSYGLGWFTQEIAYHDIHWAYGYGRSDASLFVKIPKKGLTFILLLNSDIASASTRLGEGNLLRSIPAIAFIKYALLENYRPFSQLNIMEDVSLDDKDCSTIFIEELFTHAMVRWLLPDNLHSDKSKSIEALNMIYSVCPDYFDGTRLDQFYFLSTFDDSEILKLGRKIVHAYQDLPFHPVKSYYAAVIEEKLGNSEEAIHLLDKLITYNRFWEHDFMPKAYLKLSELYLKTQRIKKSVETLQYLIETEGKNGISKEYIQLAKTKLRSLSK